MLFDPKETDIIIDWLSTLLVTLLIATLLASSIRYFPYPYGWIVITLVFIARLTANSGKMTANDPQRTVRLMCYIITLVGPCCPSYK